MKRAIALGVALLATVTTAGLSAASNTHSSFGGGLGTTNPCKGEGIGASVVTRSGLWTPPLYRHRRPRISPGREKKSVSFTPTSL